MVAENIFVNWSASIKALADEFFSRWESTPAISPFEKTIILVDDSASAKTLKRFFLLRDNPKKRVFANFAIFPVAQFINDWLFGWEKRNAKAHPYSKDILEWRIFFILKEAQRDKELSKELAELLNYSRDDERRLNLSRRLAKLYDDYLASRPELLEDWADGKVDGAWQGALYRKLVKDEPNSYSRLYSRALSGDSAFAESPSCAARAKCIHVFDLPFISYPWLKFFESMAKNGTQIHFWSFNPSPETPWYSKEDSPEGDDKPIYAMAKGAAPTLAAQDELCEYNTDSIAETGESGPRSILRANDIALHIACSPLRELQSIKNGIIDFLAKHKDASPKDILVLFADFKKYSPLVKSVFANDDEEITFKYQTDDDGEIASPVAEAFSNLLNLAQTRFEATRILSFADVEPIRRKFGIEPDHPAIFRQLLKEANIHWGFDDEGIAKALAGELKDKPAPFTWRRGLDRLLLGALIGETDGELITGGPGFGAILPAKYIENEKARATALLVNLANALKEASDILSSDKIEPAHVWAEKLQNLLDMFFEAKTPEETREISLIRKAIFEAKSAIETALGFCPGVAEPRIAASLFASSVIEKIKSSSSGKGEALSAVRLAPLKAASVYDAKFIWIAGLDAESFPRKTPKPSFDLTGSQPNAFDFTLADKDSYAFLRAIICAKERLAFSYVGQDPSTGDSKPASALMESVLEWIGENNIKKYTHPISSSDARYFTSSGELPPNYAKHDFAACASYVKSLEADEQNGEAQPGNASIISAIENIGTIDLGDILSYLESPNSFVCRKRIGIYRADIKKSAVSDTEAQKADIPFKDKRLIETGLGELATSAEALVELGRAPDIETARMEIEKLKNSENSKKIADTELKIELPPEPGKPIIIRAHAAFREYRNATPREISIDQVDLSAGNPATVAGYINLAEISGVQLSLDYARSKLTKTEMKAHAYRKAMAPFIARHIAGHAAGLKFVSALVFTNKQSSVLYPMKREEALEKWKTILEICLLPNPRNIPDLNIEIKNDSLDEETFDSLVALI